MQRRQLILSLSSLAAISAVKAKEAPKGKILIVYYSRKGENWWDGTTRVLQTGNTARMARVIQRTIGGDLYVSIQPTAKLAGAQQIQPQHTLL